MTIVETLARLAEPWASAYSDSKLLMNGVMFGHVGGFLISGGLAIAADRAVIRATSAGADRRHVHLSEFHAAHSTVLIGLAATFATGLLLFLAVVETFATAPVFWIKMGFLALLLLNGSGLRKVAHRLDSGEAPDRDWGALRRSAGDEAAATAVFEKANALDPEHYPLPVRVDDVFFRRAVSEAIDNLPRSIREYVEDVPVLVEDFPSRELLSHENVSPQILGIYVGTPRTEAEQSAQPTDVTRVMLFKRNLEKVCRDQDDLIDQIQITVRHEIGHHLGLSEEDMERLGLA